MTWNEYRPVAGWTVQNGSSAVYEWELYLAGLVRLEEDLVQPKRLQQSIQWSETLSLHPESSLS